VFQIDRNRSEQEGFEMTKHTIANLCLTMSLLLGVSVSLQAGNDEWTGGGPWTQKGLKYMGVNTLHPDTVYAVGYNDAEEGDSLIYMSTDGGTTWSSLWTGVDGPIERASYYGKDIAVHPVAPESVYALIRSTKRDTFLFIRSTNHGMRWKASYARVIEDGLCEFIAIDPVEPNRIYLSGENVPCYRSTDGGRTWDPSETPFLDPVRTNGFAINYLNNAVIYSGADTTVIKSTDYGASWEELPSGSPYKWSGMVQTQMSPDDTSTLWVASAHSSYKDLWRTTDCGQTWHEVGRFANDHSGAWFYRINPTDGGNLYVAAGDTFIYWTVDWGSQWYVLPGKLLNRPTGPMILDVISSPFDRIYTIMDGAVWTYTITDTFPPSFFNVTEWPDTNYQGPYPVAATVVDTFNETVGKNYGLADTTVLLHWQYRDVEADTTTLWYEARMRYYPSLDQWRESIPRVPLPSEYWDVRYYLSACDLLYNCSTWPEGAGPDDNFWEFRYTGIEEVPDAPTAHIFSLTPIAPNPAYGMIQIRYSLTERTHARLLVFNAAGQAVRRLVDEQRDAGDHLVIWDRTDDLGQKVSAGVYFYELRADGQRTARKMTVIQ
jgi:photosystem II stability/assembly factor-like uncharacterized protein